MAIHMSLGTTREAWKGQCSSTGEENGLWSQAGLAAKPSPAYSKSLNLSDSYLPNLQKRKEFFLASQDCERLNEIAYVKSPSTACHMVGSLTHW